MTILRRNAFEVLPRIQDAAGTAVYVDPPYVEKNATYEHDFATHDHRRLAQELGRFSSARVVVSYYAHELINELYPLEHWRRVEIEVSKAMSAQGRRDSANDVRATEVLLLNDVATHGDLFR